MKKRLLSIGLAAGLVISSSCAWIAGANLLAPQAARAAWSDVGFGDFEAEDSISGVNTGSNPNWAPHVTAEGMAVSRSTEKAISGNASMLFTGGNSLDWQAAVRKQFSKGTLAFRSGAEAITFQVYTKNSGSLSLSLYDAGKEENYQTEVAVTGKNEVQTITVALTAFVLQTKPVDPNKNLVTSMGDKLYAPDSDFPLKIHFTAGGASEILLDNFMQTKASGYQTPPAVNDDITNPGETPWNADIMFGNFENSNALDGINDSKDLLWSPEINEDHGDTKSSITLTKDLAQVLYGEQSVVLKSTESGLDWRTNLRKNFGHESQRFVKGIGAVSFQLRTQQSGELGLSLYDGTNNYIAKKAITGGADIQNIVVKLEDFLLQNGEPDQNILTHKTDLYTSPILTLKIDYTSDAPTELVLDTFMQTAADGYKQEMVNEYHTITLTTPGNGTVSGGGKLLKGSQKVITAVANEGFEFEGWYVDGQKVSGIDAYAITVDGDKTYEARFVPVADEQPGELPSGFVPAFEIKNEAFSKPAAGSLAVDPDVKLQGKEAVKWSYSFENPNQKNQTTIQKVKLAGDGFSLLVKTEHDITLKVRLTGKGIGNKDLFIDYAVQIKGSDKVQRISWSYTDIVLAKSNAVFGELNKADIGMTLELVDAKTVSGDPAVTGDFYFNEVHYMVYNDIIAFVKGEEEPPVSTDPSETGESSEPQQPGDPEPSGGDNSSDVSDVSDGKDDSPDTSDSTPAVALAALLVASGLLAAAAVVIKKNGRIKSPFKR